VQAESGAQLSADPFEAGIASIGDASDQPDLPH
jgi:hypothetical protein